MDKLKVLQDIDNAFGHISRPIRFLKNPNHCCECAEHEETLQQVTPASVSLKEVGSPAWDPLCGIKPEAFQYLMPGLARLAMGRGDRYYLDQFMFHLESFQIDGFDTVQTQAILNLLWFLFETMPEEIESTPWDELTLGRVIEKLELQLCK